MIATLLAAQGSPVLISPGGMKTLKAEPPKFDPTAPPARCLVRVAIDEGGVPTDVEARSCPASYAAAAAEAVRGWRWEPVLTETQEPARALILVAIEFTGRGRIPVSPAARCNYKVRLLPDGMVKPEGDRVPQCEIWPPARVQASAPAAGTCTVDVDPQVPRGEPGWIDVSTCTAGVEAVAAEIVANSLYTPGTETTRFVLELPTPVVRPSAAVTTFEIPSPGSEQAPTRLGGSEAGVRAPEPTLTVPSETTVPKVDLSALRNKKPTPKPAPAPVPAPAPEAAPVPAPAPEAAPVPAPVP